MTRQHVLDTLAKHQKEWQAKGVKSLAVFGSVARDEATERSDIDILVEYEPEAHVGLFEFVRLQRYLSELLGGQVDLATQEALRQEMRSEILQEAVLAG